MTGSIKDQIDVFKTLQHIETELFHTTCLLEQIPNRLQALEDEKNRIEEDLNERNRELKELTKTYKDLESEFKVNLSKIEKSDGRLRTIKSNKEYQSVLKEIDDVKRLNSDIEDRMIECLDQTETVEKSITSDRDEMDRLIREYEVESKKIRAEEQNEKEKLVELKAELERIMADMDPELYKTYTDVKEKAGRIVVAGAYNAICLGCNINIPAQMYNELQRYESLKYCPHCHRLLYWDN